MTSALATMRVDYDQVKIKDLDTSSNTLLNKRRKKAAAKGKMGSTVCNSQWELQCEEGRVTELDGTAGPVAGRCIRGRVAPRVKAVKGAP